MAFIKQLALGREVRAPIIRVVIVSTVVTPADRSEGWDFFLYFQHVPAIKSSKQIFSLSIPHYSCSSFRGFFCLCIFFYYFLQANNITAAVDVRLKDPDLRKYSVYGEIVLKTNMWKQKTWCFFQWNLNQWCISVSTIIKEVMFLGVCVILFCLSVTFAWVGSC